MHTVTDPWISDVGGPNEVPRSALTSLAGIEPQDVAVAFEPLFDDEPADAVVAVVDDDAFDELEQAARPRGRATASAPRSRLTGWM